jgi:glycosyltransferase involved in cell wall biosynthesis
MTLESPLPSVLAVTSQVPWPLDTGGHLRSFHLLRTLARHFRVRLVVPAAEGQGSALDALRQNQLDVRPVRVDRRAVWQEFFRAARAAVQSEPYVLFRRHARRAVWTALCREITHNPPDVLYLDHLDSLVFWRDRPPIPLIVDCHNIYSQLVRRAAEERCGPVRLYLRREATLLERMERRAVRWAHSVLAVSAQDVSYFGGLGNATVHLVPNGVECAAYRSLPAGRDQGSPVLLYVGAMSWAPNVSAAKFLAQEVLPTVRDHHPDARLQIVGRDPAPEVRALGNLPGVEVTGTVPDMLPYLGGAHLLAVPLESGGGTRLKILEAFAAGLPVVSSEVGCEGLGIVPGEHLLVANRAQFAEQVLAVLGKPAWGERLARQARELVRKQYDWSAVAEAACEAVAAAVRPTLVQTGEPFAQPSWS